MTGQEKTQRGLWGSKLAFILAAAGSAIGLGNIWRFPMKVGQNGGAAFVFVYILAVAFIGFTVMLAELAIGRHTQRNPVGAFEHIKPGTAWKAIGYLGVITGVGILSYYAVVSGWTVGYMAKMAGGTFRNLGTVEEATATTRRIFEGFVANPWLVIALLALVMAATTFIVSRGIKAGIERWSTILMPALFILIVLLAVRALTLPGAAKGLRFYLVPEIEGWTLGFIPKIAHLTGTSILFALGQAFFSLSLGMGTMITYGSYIRKSDNLVSSAAWVSFSDTLIAFLAGIIIFPTLFAIEGISPSEGPGLVFQVLPLIFSKIPGGQIFGIFFFVLLILAALTSTISLLEVPVAYLVDEKKWSRARAAWGVGGVTFLVGIPAALSFGGASFFTRAQVLSRMDLIFGNISLATGALFISIFVGYIWRVKNAIREIQFGNPRFALKPLWGPAIKFLAPAAILTILIFIRIIAK